MLPRQVPDLLQNFRGNDARFSQVYLVEENNGVHTIRENADPIADLFANCVGRWAPILEIQPVQFYRRFAWRDEEWLRIRESSSQRSPNKLFEAHASLCGQASRQFESFTVIAGKAHRVNFGNPERNKVVQDC